jgi:small subunit ribosomal protein S17
MAEDTEIEETPEANGASTAAGSGASGETPVTETAARKPKAKRKPPVRKALTPEERHAERVEERRKKALHRRTERAAARAEHKAVEHATEATPAREQRTGVQKTRQGVVVSDKADKTITVRIDVARRHRRYQKIVRTSSTVHAHDERNEAHTGDTVVVREARPLSRTKRWRLVEVVERAK